jgi:hypothetical protein
MGNTFTFPRDNDTKMGQVSQRLHIGANDVTNPAHLGISVDLVDAGPFLAKTIL